MKVTYSWLKDFVDIKIPPAELAEKLTMAGLEVVSLEEIGGDSVFEIEITSNRPDWLSVTGVAREIGAICGLKFKTVNLKERKIKSKECLPVKISVSDKKDCSFYSARVICDVLVEPSPDWLKKRLTSLGCRPVNNVVDITNYILFETGQPLHVFDLDSLSQKEVNVRRAKTDEKIITIDGQQEILNPEILVIADKDKPIAIAGIMGGKETEVTFKTRNILLESAVFDPILVRRAKQKLAIQSESAYRFERGVDFETAKTASLAAQELILKLASGRPCVYKSIGIKKSTNPIIRLDAAYVNRVLGLTLSVIKIKQILSGLGLQVRAKTKNTLLVKIPSFRQDLKLQIDLIEEVARVYGYEKIPKTLPVIRLGQNISDKNNITCGIKKILSGLGLREVITYSLVDRNLLVKSGINTERNLVKILNPISCEQEVLRPTLLPSLIRCVAYNLDQQQESIKVFEIANTFSAGANSTREESCLGIALCGINSFLTRQGLVKDEITLLHLKGILETLFSRLGVRGFDFIRKDDHRIDIIVGQEETGFILDLARQTLEAFDIKNRQVVLAELSLEKLLSHINLDKKFSNIAKFPPITRDISFVVKNEVPVKDLISAIEAKGASLLRQARVVDYYRGKQIPEGFTGLTISCVYRLDERTLTEEEIYPLHNEICFLLKERFGIRLR
ncbi:MAG: phenylalanine--tRNA ligase subunit beta [Candidatus Omnitrophica bacterium]|nr:phenylalanine--tRNA ligase subunit beta [Candidatus Omnitrophota bacterium]